MNITVPGRVSQPSAHGLGLTRGGGGRWDHVRAEGQRRSPSDGIPLGIRRHDLDGDGQVVMMFTTNKLGFFKVIGAILTRSISLDFEFYRMEDGIYPDKPSSTRNRVLRFLASQGKRQLSFRRC